RQITFPGVATGKAYFRPASGRRAAAGARLAASLSADRSPLWRRRHSPRAVGGLFSAARRAITPSPPTTPRCSPPLASKPTIFMTLPRLLVRSFSNVCRIGKGAERPAIADATTPQQQGSRREMRAQHLTSGEAGLQVPRIDDGEAETA